MEALGIAGAIEGSETARCPDEGVPEDRQGHPLASQHLMGPWRSSQAWIGTHGSWIDRQSRQHPSG